MGHCQGEVEEGLTWLSHPLSADLQNGPEVNNLIPEALSPDSARFGALTPLLWVPSDAMTPSTPGTTPPQEPWENFPLLSTSPSYRVEYGVTTSLWGLFSGGGGVRQSTCWEHEVGRGLGIRVSSVLAALTKQGCSEQPVQGWIPSQPCPSSCHWDLLQSQSDHVSPSS